MFLSWVRIFKMVILIRVVWETIFVRQKVVILIRLIRMMIMPTEDGP